MSKEKVTVRLESSIIAAYEHADGPSRSAAMREVLRNGITDGEVDVPDRYERLAEIEQAKSESELNRRRGRFKEIAYDWFRDRWARGCVTPTDVRSLADSWRKEAEVHADTDGGTKANLRFLDAMIEWYADSWKPTDESRPEWPDAGVFIQQARGESVPVPDHIRSRVERAKQEGRDETEVRRVIGDKVGIEVVNQAIREVY